MGQSFWHIRNCSLFQRLTEQQLELLEKRARQRKFAKGSSVYLPTDRSDGAFLLAEGRVRICATTPEGKQSILAFVEAGELFGELALLEPGQREERADVVNAATIILIPGDILRELMEVSAPLALGVTKLIGLRRRRIERRLRSLLFRSNRERLTHLLIELSEQYGNPTSEGIELAIRLSHQDLASIIGATRETVTTLLGEMQSEGLLQIKRQRLLILDWQRLGATE
ncbi:Crp/Fnr family transcriptional regulator [Aureliella helgolandensis]|uniref:Global nitrogen regulator n=1 Tax=Aureliella helgolandensis TaxID=2527968 RepID=A0A518G6M5_9BACT|nr:Crp/Fnr family transcriptional regulator [Aureliella helgolandensis]QDV24248.1 Global nitrogen regulator [Aureliella helgolandensis]